MSDSRKSGKTRKVKEARMVPTDVTVMSAAEFKTHCLQLMDRVQRERSEVVVTKYGRPVAKLVPYEEEPASPLGWLRGTVTVQGDIVGPVDEAWEADA